VSGSKYTWNANAHGLIRKGGKFFIGRVPGMHMYRAEDIDAVLDEVDEAYGQIMALNAGHGGNVAQRLRAYRKWTEVLIGHVLALSKLNEDLCAERQQLMTGKGDQAGRRWTDEQDAALVELACEPDASMIKMALTMCRTPGAVASRLTYLVGVSKVSRHVVGRITGYLDGEPVSGVFDGEVRNLAAVRPGGAA
jgi:hypothetical protein